MVFDHRFTDFKHYLKTKRNTNHISNRFKPLLADVVNVTVNFTLSTDEYVSFALSALQAPIDTHNKLGTQDKKEMYLKVFSN
jgi:hypothetical protein